MKIHLSKPARNVTPLVDRVPARWSRFLHGKRAAELIANRVRRENSIVLPTTIDLAIRRQFVELMDLEQPLVETHYNFSGIMRVWERLWLA